MEQDFYVFFLLQSLYTMTTNLFMLTTVSQVPVTYPRKREKSTYGTLHSRRHLLLNRSNIGNLISNICFLLLQSFFTVTTNPFRLSIVSQVPVTYPRKHEKSTYGIFYSRRQLLLKVNYRDFSIFSFSFSLTRANDLVTMTISPIRD